MQETFTVPLASVAIAAILDESESWARALRGTRAKTRAKARIPEEYLARSHHSVVDFQIVFAALVQNGSRILVGFGHPSKPASYQVCPDESVARQFSGSRPGRRSMEQTAFMGSNPESCAKLKLNECLALLASIEAHFSAVVCNHKD
jgi:hypothetical protein